MQFIDEAKIFIQSGSGGNGCLSFRREANVPKGGPDGGNGGRGGDIIARCVPNLNTLIDYRYTQHFRANSGESGKGKNRFGSNGKSIYLDLPLGTQIFDESGEHLLFDMDLVGQESLVLKGGEGGLGNTVFKSSTNKAPRKITLGEKGKGFYVRLKLKLFSDVGIVGFPNAGKSTFIRKVSRAQPKVADYPFTTLRPYLGVVYIHEKEFVISDIPGLIEGAHKGSGLGIRFLKHIERCNIILHLIDVSASENIYNSYNIISNELKLYSKKLSDKTEFVALNKSDLSEGSEIAKEAEDLSKKIGKKVYIVSAITGYGLKELLNDIFLEVEKSKIKL